MGTPTLPDRALDWAYPIPRDTASIEEWRRRRHLDLPHLSSLDLDREAFGLARRLYRDRDPGRVAWLVERRDAIRAEVRRRLDAAHATAIAVEPTGVAWRRPPRPPLIVRKGGERSDL